MKSDWVDAKVKELMKFLESEVNKTADGMYRNERARREATYINMWKQIIDRVALKNVEIKELELRERKEIDNMSYWLDSN